MATFTNPTKKAVPFKLGVKEYVAPAGGTVIVPDKLAYAIEKRGLPLKREADAKDESGERMPETEEGILWHKRAHAERAQLGECARALDECERALDECEKQLRAAREHIQTLNDARDSLTNRANHAESEVARLNDIVAQQQARITAVEGQLAQTKRERDAALASAPETGETGKATGAGPEPHGKPPEGSASPAASTPTDTKPDKPRHRGVR